MSLKKLGSRLKLTRHQLILFLYFSGWIGYFTYFWSQLFWLDSMGNLVAGHINVWGDWAAHFTMGSAMAYRQFLLPVSPLLSTAIFSYPFVADLLSAVLIRLGIPFLPAFTSLSLIFSVGLVFALFYFYKTLFQSQRIALLASLIFLLNGGVGWFYFAQDVSHSAQPWQTFLNPPHEYTRLDTEHLKWINVIDSMVIPQRAFTLGFPLTLLALGLMLTLLRNPQLKARQSWLKVGVIGLCLGLMPLIHTHSFLAAAIILAFWCGAYFFSSPPKKKSKLIELALYVASLTMVIAGPIIHFYFAHQVSSGFFKWYPGWLAKEYQDNWFIFWWKNWQLVPLLAGLGWWFYFRQSTTFRAKLRSLLMFAPFFLLFLAANLWLFQPFSWDNTKLFAWVSVGFSGLAAWLLLAIWNQYRYRVIKIGVCLLFALTIASGTIDAYRILRHDLHGYVMYSREELELTQWVKDNTPVDQRWLTGNNHNHWLFNLTGRQTIMAYPGWLWTHGYDYLPVQRDVQLMYEHPLQYRALFAQYEVGYVLVDPNAKQNWRVNTDELGEIGSLIKQTGNYAIYEVKDL